MKLEQMHRTVLSARDAVRERGLDVTVPVLLDLCDVVAALVEREAQRVPLPLDTPKPMPTTVVDRPMRMIRVAESPTLDTMTEAQIDRFFPRGTVVNHYYVRRDFELYQPHPGQPSLFSIRRKAGK